MHKLHIHLDPHGGIAGDMFAAALLHAFPERLDGVVDTINAVVGARCRLMPYNDGVLSGSRFIVESPVERQGRDASHGHVHWSDIRRDIQEADIRDDVRAHALGIFQCLAEAEARVHGVAPEDVEFHEVGAVDSIADIMAASYLIAFLGAVTWSVSALPLGSGRVDTAHGVMPVPAPATAILLEGFQTHDDGIPGERVTPTGAAILRYLMPAATRPAGILRVSGFGFGTRRLPGISNCLRVMALDVSEAPLPAEHRELAVISFEVDDQSGEELAAGLDRVRAMAGVHDVVQVAAFGKKNRLAVHVQVLARPDALEQTVEACFRETTTIGLRIHSVLGRALPRRFVDLEVEGVGVRVKLVDRPGGPTAKAEADHLSGIADHAARSRLRRAAEREAESR